jgi:hypothetical protein
MDLKGYVSISGQGGLYKIISQAKNGLIVESLIDKKRIPAYANQKVLALEDISIFCVDGDTPLKDVFEKIYAKTNGGPTLDSKSDPEVLATYLLEVLPNFDRPRVYNSDLKKLFSWFNLLQHAGALVPSKEEEVVEEKKEVVAKTEKKAPSAKSKTPEKAAKPVKQAPKMPKSTGVRKTG